MVQYCVVPYWIVRDFNSENCLSCIEIFAEADESRDWLQELSFYGDSLTTIVGGLSYRATLKSLSSLTGEMNYSFIVFSIITYSIGVISCVVSISKYINIGFVFTIVLSTSLKDRFSSGSEVILHYEEVKTSFYFTESYIQSLLSSFIIS